jgi:hypothetical protein
MSKEENDTDQLTFEKSEAEYGPNYQNHLMELYKFYAGTADAVSTRRQSANVFFLTLNTALIALIGYSFRSNTVENIFLWLLILAVIVGLILCYQWYRTIKSHQQLNDGKFEVINLIEEKLPFAPYAAEWKALGEGKDPKKYKKITNIEMNIPWVFALLHFILLCILIWRQCN